MFQTGITLMHEHITIDLSRKKKDEDTQLRAKEETIKELLQLRDFGVTRILDVTNHGMGRDPDYVSEVSKATGINVLMCTGYYKRPFFPASFYEQSVEEIAEGMIHELEDGIVAQGKLVQASAIGEIGTSETEWTSGERKLFEAAVIAHKKTDALITTHTTLGQLGMEQVLFFEEKGADLSRVVIGHQDLNEDEGEVLEMASHGVTLGFDTIGKTRYRSDTERIRTLLKLIDAGFAAQIVFSMDITRRSHLEDKGGIGYRYLFQSFLPLARRMGVSEEMIFQILCLTPNRLLGSRK